MALGSPFESQNPKESQTADITQLVSGRALRSKLEKTIFSNVSAVFCEDTAPENGKFQ
jgi:hypothetical protein